MKISTVGHRGAAAMGIRLWTLLGNRGLVEDPSPLQLVLHRLASRDPQHGWRLLPAACERAAVSQAGGYAAGVTGSTIHNFRSYLIREAAVGVVAAFDASYQLRGGVFTSGGSRLRSSLRCVSVGSGSSKNTSHMIQAASGMRFGSSMSVLTRLCALGGRFATPSEGTSEGDVCQQLGNGDTEGR
jgi:hypothetical protein